MNPLVEEMLTAKSRQDLEIAMLEELLTGDVKCESRTHNNGRAKCTGDVAYLLRTCEHALKVCTGMGSHVLYEMNWDAPCRYCMRPCSECWTITPI